MSDHEILAGSADNHVRLYDLRNGKLTADFLGSIVTCVSLNRDGMCYLASCSDNTIKLMDKQTGELLNSYKGHKSGDYQTESCISSDGNLVFGGSVNGDIFIWDFLTADVKLIKTHGAFVVQTISAHPKNLVFLTGAANTVKIWQKTEIVDV